MTEQEITQAEALASTLHDPETPVYNTDGKRLADYLLALLDHVRATRRSPCPYGHGKISGSKSTAFFCILEKGHIGPHKF